MDAHPGSEFSLINCRSKIDGSDTATNGWVVDFALRNENPNRTLASILTDQPRSWTFPIEIGLDHLERIAGPGKKFHENETRWNARIDRLRETISDIQSLPPLIVLAGEPSEGSKRHALVVADGAHRMEALRQMGRTTLWVLVGFHAEHSKRAFLTEYASGTYLGTHAPSQQGITMSQEQLHGHYVGSYAKNYDKIREQQPHWHTEHAAVEKLLSHNRGASVLDAPVGTGRFVSLYKKLGCSVIGSDISSDMLAETAAKAKAEQLSDIKLVLGNAAETAFDEVDVALCIRFINLVSAEVAEKVVHNLGRASRKEMLIHITTIDLDIVPEDARAKADEGISANYERQKEKMQFVSHRLSDFTKWAADAGFKIVESIECQERHGHSRTHVHRLMR